ncbi:hypothetical protein [Armatimonas sp.]|uniref:hypothetical protein n=1 Tax=Armatimonas sp. TaxID=1872638 RepID=UPI00286AFABB|nr:hypothetical protein [Armatimonas sp.]
MPTVLSAEEIQPVLHRLSVHWSDVEAELGRSFSLQSGYLRALLDSDLLTLTNASALVTEPENEAQRAATSRDLLRQPLLLRFDQVKNAISATLSGTAHAAALPKKPSPSASAIITLKAFADLSEVWGKINVDTAVPASERPLSVVGGYTKESFDSDCTALRAAFVAVDDSRRSATQRRKDRDSLVPPLRKRLTQYRARVKSLLPAGHRLLATLP